MLSDVNNITFEECRTLFTEPELQLLHEAGQHIVMRSDFFAFNADVPEELLEKFDRIFSYWIGDQRQGKTSDEIIRAYLDFIQGLGIEVHIEENASEARSTIVYGKDTGISIITEEKTHTQLQNLQLPGQQRFEFYPDGTSAIVCDDDEAVVKLIRNSKSEQGYNLFLLQVIGNGIASIIQKNKSVTDLSQKLNESDPIKIPRKSLQEFLGIRINKPTQKELNFILSGKEPKTKEGKELRDRIMRHYPFWVDLINLTKAGVYKTETGLYSIFTFGGYNEEEDVIECDSPYLRHCYKELYTHPIREGAKEKNMVPWELYAVSPPGIRGSFYGASGSTTTKEIFDYLVYRIATRGVTPDAQLHPNKNYKNKKQIKIRVTYSNIIDECPLLKKKLTDKVHKKNGDQEAPDAQYKRMILKRAFFGETYPGKKSRQMSKAANQINKYGSIIEELFRDHTDYYKRFVNFRIVVDAISLKELGRTGITITHEGKDGEYYDNPELTSPDVM